MAKVPAAQVTSKNEGTVAPELLNQLKVDADKKAAIRKYWETQKQNNQQEAARQHAEHEKIVKAGKENYMPTTGIPAKVEEK